MSHIEYNDDQKAAIHRMLTFMTTPKEQFFLLEGFAGTGKSTCIQEVVRQVNVPVVLTAPTNKATRVLMEISSNEGLSVQCCTIHSLLGLRLKGTAAKQHLAAEGESKMPLYGLVVVDEGSMVSPELCTHVYEQALNYNVKVIFMADPAQLPPVGEKCSPIFDDISNRAKLTKVMRHDNQILNLATRVRSCWESGRPAEGMFISDNDEKGGVFCVGDKQFYAAIRKAFTSESYLADPASVRIIAWTNEAVRSYNETVRDYLYGDDKKPFHIGERVVLCQPLIDVREKKSTKQTNIIMTTDQEAKVLGVSECQHPIYPSFRVLNLALECDDGEVNEAFVIHPEEEKTLAQTLSNMAEEAKVHRGSWSSFWEMKGLFSDVRPCHAITAHRSQGSTYDSVLVDALNIQMNRNTSEMLQCMYVAVSRASRLVVARTR